MAVLLVQVERFSPDSQNTSLPVVTQSVGGALRCHPFPGVPYRQPGVLCQPSVDSSQPENHPNQRNRNGLRRSCQRIFRSGLNGLHPDPALSHPSAIDPPAPSPQGFARLARSFQLRASPASTQPLVAYDQGEKSPPILVIRVHPRPNHLRALEINQARSGLLRPG